MWIHPRRKSMILEIAIGFIIGKAGYSIIRGIIKGIIEYHIEKKIRGEKI